MTSNLFINAINIETDPNVTYSLSIAEEQDQAIRDKVVALAKEIYAQISQKDHRQIDHITFKFQTKGTLSFDAQINDGEKLSYSLNDLDPEIQQRCEQLAAEVNRLGLIVFNDHLTRPAPPLPFQPYSPQTESSDSIFHRFVLFIQRYFHFSRTISPLIHQTIVNQIKDLDIEQLKELYVQPDEIYQTVKKEINLRIPSGLFEEEEIEAIVQEKLIGQIQKTLKNKKEAAWDDKTFYQLNISRLFKFIENYGLTAEAANSLRRLSPLDIPYDQLASIPATPENQEELALIWKEFLGNLFAKGRIAELSGGLNAKEKIIYGLYAAHFLKAVEHVPADIKSELKPFLDELHQLQPTKKIRTFLLNNSALSQLEIPDEKFNQEKDLYIQTIRPLFKELINSVLNGSSDGMEIAKFLAFEKSSVQKMNQVIAKAQKQLTAQQKALFDQERLKELFINEIERVAAFYYQFTHVQLDNLRESRKVMGSINADKEALLEAIKSYQKKKAAVISKHKKKPKPEVEKLTKLFLAELDKFLKSKEFTLEIVNEIRTELVQAELDGPVWKQLLVHHFNRCKMKEILPDAEFTPLMKQQIDSYLEVKSAIQNFSAADRLRLGFEELIEEHEKQTTHPLIQEYLKTTSVSSSAGLNKWLFGDEVLESMRTAKDETPFFNVNELADLMILSRVIYQFENGIAAPEIEQRQVQEILKRSKGNQELIEKLKQLDPEEKTNDDYLAFAPDFLKGIARRFMKKDFSKIKSTKIPMGITNQAASFLSAYVKYTANLAKFEAELPPIQQRAEHLLQKFSSDPSQIRPEDKLTLKEIGTLSRSALLSGKIEKFGKVFAFDPAVQKLTELTVPANEIYKKLEAIMKPAVKDHYEDGSLLAYSGKKKSTWLGRSLPPEERLTTYASNGFTHGAKLYHQGDDLSISHLYGNHLQEEIGLYHLCISDIWELDISSLVSPEMAQQLQMIDGDKWKDAVNEMFQAIEKNLHSNGAKRFEKLTNLSERRFAAGFADHPWLYRLLGRGKVKGHQRKDERDFQKLHGKFFGNIPLGKEQICSEFASKTTLASMIELNKRLSKKIAKNNSKLKGEAVLKQLKDKGCALSQEVEAYLNGERFTKKEAAKTRDAEKQLIALLENENYSTGDIELIIRLGNNEIFDLPYDKKERLKAIHPGRMVQLLVDKGCAKLKPLPEELNYLFNLNGG